MRFRGNVRLCLILLSLLAGSAAARAVPAEETVSRLLEALALDDEAELREGVPMLFSRRLLDKHGPDKLARILGSMRDDLRRPQEPPRIVDERRSDHRAELVVRSEASALKIVLDFEPETGRIDGLEADTDVSGATPGPGPLPAKRLPEAIGGYLDDLAARDAFSGVVLVARHGKPIFAKAYGEADRSRGIANTLDTPINVGSMTKMFTGLAVMQLVRQGKIDLDATVGRYLPDLPNARVRGEVTIRQLLTHRSGIGSYWNDEFFENAGTIDDLDGLLATFIEEPLLFEPGAGYEYSNGGPVVLGKIVEAVSGRSYFDYLRERIYRPAGMKHSGHFRKDDREAGFAHGYHRSSPDDPRRDTHAMRPLIGSPAGSSFHSARDLLRFIDALAAGKLIDDEGREMLWAPRVRESDDFAYGFLWGNETVNGHRSVGHNGGAPGVSADLKHFPELGYTTIVLSNYSRAAGPVAEWIAEAVTRAQGG